MVLFNDLIINQSCLLFGCGLSLLLPKLTLLVLLFIYQETDKTFEMSLISKFCISSHILNLYKHLSIVSGQDIASHP